MPRTRPPYPEEFRDRIVELARAGHPACKLAKEFEPLLRDDPKLDQTGCP
jgi:transposase